MTDFISELQQRFLRTWSWGTPKKTINITLPVDLLDAMDARCDELTLELETPVKRPQVIIDLIRRDPDIQRHINS